jgi:SagB-type dehydrogenase family enzyme
MADVLAAYTDSPVADISPHAFRLLLDDLLEAGVLQDAAQVLPNLADLGRPDSLWGRAYSESTWPTKLELNHHDADVRWVDDFNSPLETLSWHGLVQGRQSTYRFKNQGLSMSELGQLLLCYAAVGRKQTAVRRAVPSGGGLYQLKLWLLLLKPCDGFVVGVYEAAYRTDGSVGLMHKHGLTDTDLWQQALRASTDPAALQHASAWLVVGADLKAIAKKYRNLAYSHALIEAGAVLQNLGLIASSLNVGMHLRAGFDHARLHVLCHAGDVTLLISAVMGVKSATESVCAETLRIKMGWATEASELPFHVATARVRFDDHASMDCFGRSRDAALAYDKAMSEALERYAMMRGPKSVIARWDELPNMIHPHAVLRWMDVNFDETQSYNWIEFQNLASGQAHYVLQDLCFYHPNHQASGTSYCVVNTSGMACAPSRDMALTLATLELVERDAFMRAWLTGASCQPLSLQMLDEDTRALFLRFEAEGCRVVLGLLPSAWAVVVMAFVQHEQLSFTHVSAAADFDATSAASKAMAEVASGVVSSLSGVVPGPVEVANVLMPADHGYLYCQHDYFRQADFLIAFRSETQEALPTTMSHDLWHRMWLAGLHIYACEVALPEEREYLHGGLPVVCRVVIPGLIAMVFGSAIFPLPEVVVPAWRMGESPINRALVHPFS